MNWGVCRPRVRIKWWGVVLPVGIVLLLAAFLTPGVASAQDPIRIGVVGPRTGVFAAFGEYLVEGVTLALEEAGYKVKGRTIKVFIEDTAGNVEQLVTKLRALQERDKVHAVVGPVLGGEGLAAVDWAKESRMPVVVAYSAPEDVTMRKAVKNVVRAGWTGAQPMFPFGEYAAKDLGYRRIVMVGQDYSFPYNQIGGFIRGFCRAGGKEVRRIWHPVGTKDYSSILATLPRDVDAVMYNGAGSDMVAFFKQWHEFGLGDKLPLIGGSNAFDSTILKELGEKAVGGFSAIQYAEGLQTENFLKFKKTYTARWGKVPAAVAEHGYVSVKMVLRAVEAVNGRIEDTDGFIKALRATKMPDAPRGPFYLDDYGNPVQNIYIRKVQKIDGELVNVPVKTIEKVSQFGPYAANPTAYMAQPPDSRDYPSGNCAEVK